MPRYIAQGKKALEAFLKSREARSTLQEMVRGIPEDSPALQPLLNAARTFNGRLLSLSGMPERPIEVVEQEAIEAAQQLQTALNDLSSQQPELYRQHAEAFERTWQGLELEIEGAEPQAQAQEVPKAEAAPQAQAQEAPKAEAAEKVDFFNISPRALARIMTRALKNNSPELKAFDELARRINESKETEKLKGARYNVTSLRKNIAGLVPTVDSPEEVAGDYLVAGTQVVQLRKAMAKLQKSDSKLYARVFGPFVQAMEGLDFSKEQAEYAQLQAKQNAALEAEENRDKAEVKEANANSRKVTFYGNMEIMENTGLYYSEVTRAEIINDPGFKETPPYVDPQKLAKLLWITMNTLDFGMENPLKPNFKETMESESYTTWKYSPTYYERLAKEPEVARLLSQREEGKTWHASSQEKLTEYMEDVFNKRYQPNHASEEARKENAAALAEAYDTFREYGAPLQDAGNEEIGIFYKQLRDVQDKNGSSAASINTNLLDAGRAFLDSITEPGMEQTEETRECLKATLKALHGITPADEFAQICEDMNRRRGIENDPANLDYVTPEMFDPKDLKSGLKLIDDLKKGLKTDESARDEAAKIMAARILTDTKGGKASYLDIPISQTRVDQVAEALKGSASFSQWLNGLDKNKAAKLLSGHGGDLEQSFKNHLKKLPAGELKNDPALRRYMPTAKERIEELQKQAEQADKDKNLSEEQKELRKARAAAEVIAIRNACRAERGGAGLKKQIPPAGEGYGIADTVSTMVNDENCRKLLAGKAVQDALQKGHGGQMLVDARAGSKNMQVSEDSAKILFENTVQARKAALRAEADQLMNEFGEGSTEALLKQARRLLGEYAALVTAPSTRDNPEQDMKWQAMDKMATKAETDPLFVAMTNSTENTQEALNWVGDYKEGEFRQKFTERTNSIQGKETKKASAPKEREVEIRKEEAENTYDEMDRSFDLC